LVTKKLYLSSYRVRNGRNALVELVGAPGRAGIVFNAFDGFADRMRILDREVHELRTLGFECEELDLRSYFHDLDGLTDRLSHLQFLWVVGGNSFVLARAMTQSRLGEALAKLSAWFRGGESLTGVQTTPRAPMPKRPRNISIKGAWTSERCVTERL
jgi:Peptidase family S51